MRAGFHTGFVVLGGRRNIAGVCGLSPQDAKWYMYICIIDNFCYPYLMIHSTQSQCKSAYFGSRLIFSLCVVQCTWSIEVKLGLILGEGN